MVLFVDETEDASYFIVSGILVESREEAASAYVRFKKRKKNFPITDRFKMDVYREFKSTLLDKRYQRIKQRMIEQINDMDCRIIYACFKKAEGQFSQEMKESAYVSLLSRIALYIEDDVSIVYDAFNIPTFDKKIVAELSKVRNVQAIMGMNSQSEPGLQFADNICSVVRRFKTAGEKNEWYKTLEKKIFEA